MKHLAKRTLSLLLAALMVLTIIPANPTTVHAAASVSYYWGYKNDKTFLADGLAFAGGGTDYPKYYAYAIGAGKTARVQITAEDRAALLDAVGYKGNMTVEVEYYIGTKLPTASTTIPISQSFSVFYGKSDNTLPELLLTSVTPQASTDYTYKAVFTCDYANMITTYGGVEYFAFDIKNTGSSYLGIKSISLTINDYKPQFVTTVEEYSKTFYDNQPFEDIIIKNSYRAKTIKGQATFTHSSGQSKTVTGAVTDLPAKTDSFVVMSADQIKASLWANGAYTDGSYSMKVIIAIDNNLQNTISRTFTFTRKNTIQRYLDVYEGNVRYRVQKLALEDDPPYPNLYEYTITNADETVNRTGEIEVNFDPDTNYAELNPIASELATLDDDTYTVTVTAKHETTVGDGEEAQTVTVVRTEDTVEYVKCSHDETCYDDANDKTCNKCGFVRAINGANMLLDTQMEYNVYVSIPEAKAEGAYARIQQNGVTKAGTVSYHSEEYGYKITLPVAAKDLCDELTVEIYDKYGNQIGEVKESFAAYAYRTLNPVSEANEETSMIAYMVDYATAAQAHFQYNLEQKSVKQQLNDMDITDLSKYYLAVDTENNAVAPEKTEIYRGTNFVLKNNITMNLFTTDEVNYAVVSFTDYMSETHTMGIPAVKRGEGYNVFNVSEFVTADGGIGENGSYVEVTAKFYATKDDADADADGTQAVDTVKDSLASYIKRAKEAEAEDADKVTFFDAMMKFATAARTYFSTVNQSNG